MKVEYLQSTRFIDSDHESVRSLAKRLTKGSSSDHQKAVRIYFGARDGWKYNPYNISLKPEALKVSNIIQRQEGHCIDKALIMIACLRAERIPARLRLAKVRNHIATEKMERMLETDELVPHGIVEVYLKEKWVKATPSFNRSLCQRLNVEPLDFDGINDSLFQQYDKEGNQFMEYIEDYGTFSDLPLETMSKLMKIHYPGLFSDKLEVSRLDFSSEPIHEN